MKKPTIFLCVSFYVTDLNSKNCIHLDSFLYGPDEEERLVRNIFRIRSCVSTDMFYINSCVSSSLFRIQIRKGLFFPESDLDRSKNPDPYTSKKKLCITFSTITSILCGQVPPKPIHEHYLDPISFLKQKPDGSRSGFLNCSVAESKVFNCGSTSGSSPILSLNIC